MNRSVALPEPVGHVGIDDDEEDVDTLNETDSAKAGEEYARVRNRVKKLFGTGELDTEQCEFLLLLLPETNN